VKRPTCGTGAQGSGRSGWSPGPGPAQPGGARNRARSAARAGGVTAGAPQVRHRQELADAPWRQGVLGWLQHLRLCPGRPRHLHAEAPEPGPPAAALHPSPPLPPSAPPSRPRTCCCTSALQPAAAAVALATAALARSTTLSTMKLPSVSMYTALPPGPPSAAGTCVRGGGGRAWANAARPFCAGPGTGGHPPQAEQLVVAASGQMHSPWSSP
jgi:hypothetical protein